jgi:O-antigen/teichoic acid export membrane protein
MYALVYTVGAGVFSPLEFELSRALAQERASGADHGDTVRAVTALGFGGAALVSLVLLLASPLTKDHLFAADPVLEAALVLAVFGLLLSHLSRGALAGLGSFGRYGGQLASEAALRVGLCVGLAAFGVVSASAYGFVLATAILASAVATFPVSTFRLGPWSRIRLRKTASAVSWLLASSLLQQLLINSGVVLVMLLARGDQEREAGRLLSGLVLTRLPAFAFSAVSLVLLPRLAALLESDRMSFVRLVRGLFIAVAVIGVVASAAAGVLGPAAMRLLFGAAYVLSPGQMVALTLGGAFFMAAGVLTSALIALRSYALVCLGWASGVVAFALVVLSEPALVDRVVHGYFVGNLVAAFAIGIAVVVRISRPAELGESPSQS